MSVNLCMFFVFFFTFCQNWTHYTSQICIHPHPHPHDANIRKNYNIRYQAKGYDITSTKRYYRIFMCVFVLDVEMEK